MRHFRNFAVALLAAAVLPAAGNAGTIGGAHYATQYDYNEFRRAVEGRTFRVDLSGNPFPEVAADDIARRLLPVMQAAKPRPQFAFTYDRPAERPRPDYRMVLIYDPANDLGGDSVCNGVTRHRPPTPGRLYVFGVYCRNDLPLSQTTAWTDATSPEDPRVRELFWQLFSTLFSDSPALLPQSGFDRR